MDININASVKEFNTPEIQRLIMAYHEDICNLCFEKVNIGDKVCWYGKGFGVRHYACYTKRASLLTQEEFDKLSNW